jgi:hypothetical protein
VIKRDKIQMLELFIYKENIRKLETKERFAQGFGIKLWFYISQKGFVTRGVQFFLQQRDCNGVSITAKTQLSLVT